MVQPSVNVIRGREGKGQGVVGRRGNVYSGTWMELSIGIESPYRASTHLRDRYFIESRHSAGICLEDCALSLQWIGMLLYLYRVSPRKLVLITFLSTVIGFKKDP